MEGKTKMVIVALVLAVLSATFLTAPALAEVTGADNGDQDQERLQTRDGSCDGDMLQTRSRERLRVQDCECKGEQLGTQTCERLRTQNQICNAECEGYRSGGQFGPHGK
jgi:hypothetical protein